MKTCTKCKIEKPFEAFCKNKGAKDGHAEWCKECIKNRQLEFEKSPLMQLERQVKSSIMLENKLLAREGKKLCTTCKDIFLIDDLRDGGRCKNCDIEYKREYRLKNKDKIKKYKKKYKENNKDKIREYQKENDKKYREKNKDKIKEYRKEYYLKKKLEMQNNT